ncbi:MAG: carboxypeptidase regulatory-like domain-containing protein [Candidatus Kerfeldbacteria bacterium]|nr:carboxypeptidase regulatory-like domain-containing protein [Candidatus Kerfeldbacteria bacterium]
MDILRGGRSAVLAIGSAAILLIGLVAGSQFAAAGALTFSGTVVTPSGGTYADGGWLNLYNSTVGYGSGIDSTGKFEITGMDPGTYTLDVGIPTSSAYASPAQQQVTLTASTTGFQVKAAAPALRGVLAKPDGTPTTGCVNVRNSTWTVNRNSCPGDDGAWKIGGLDAGTYILEANPPQNSTFVGSEQKVTVSDPSSTVDLGTVKLENPFIIGKVAFPDGSLLPWNDDWSKRYHLSVDLWNSDYTINKHSDYDQNSKFKFGKVPAGTYTLHVNIWDTEQYTGSENITLTVPAGGLDLTGTPTKLTTPQLSGVVYRPDGTTPVQGAWVTLHNDDWTQNQGSSTDANGQYRIGGLPAGTYTFEVNPPSDMTDVVRPDGVAVTVTSQKTTKNVTLSGASKYATGTVKKKDGTAVSCAQVNANRRGASGWANARTNSAGEYILTLAPGSWNIRVEPDRGFDCPDPDWIFVDSEAIVEFSSDSSRQAEVVNFTVQKASAVITGKVTKKDGTPVTNGNVNANSQTQDGRSRWSNAQIKADGSYKLYLVAGTYTIDVWTPDTRLYAKNQKVAVADNQTVTTNFVMSEKLAHITGKVTTQDGTGLPNIQINGNLDCGPQGCSAWSNTKTDADGNFDLAATAGRWFINFDGGQTATYVYDGPSLDVYVASDTATVSGVNIKLTYADVTVKGKIVDDTGKAFSDLYGWAYVRPLTTTAGAGYREYGGSVNGGTFNFRIPSKLFALAELGIHMPPNSQYSASSGQTITLVADATIEKDIVVKKNDGAIVGRVTDSSGLPLKNCSFRGDVYANSERGQWYGTQVNADCSYEISLLSGTYQLGYNFDQSSGFLNRPPSPDAIVVASGTRVQKDIKVLIGDARLSVLVLNPDGSPARRVWVWTDNHEEVDALRRSSEERDRGQEDTFKGPGGTSSPEEVLKYCSKPENEKECRDFKLPPGAEGPGGCKNALECTQYCQKHKAECEREFKGETSSSSGKLSVSSVVRKSRVASLRLVRAQAETKDEERDFFDNMLSSGSETNDQGVATVSLLSGHQYTVNAGLPPDSKYMPPKFERVNLSGKSANVTLKLRDADGKMTGFVTFNNQAVQNGWVSCWSEDGNNNGGPIINGSYSLNYTFNSTYHCNANAQSGTAFLHSDEKIVTINKEKTKTVNFTLGAANFQIPPPVSESFDATQSRVITLGDGTTINIPANALASSGTVTVNANPTINVQSQKTAQPLGYGYNFEAIDANGQPITKFKDTITACFKYTDAMLADIGVEEASLVPSYWDSGSGTWKQPNNITQDTDNNSVCVRSDHFTTYGVVSASGQGRGKALVPVKTTQSKGVTKITIGSGSSKKTITPFSKYKGNVAVGTLSTKKAGQVIVAVQAGKSSDATAVKVYSLKGKLTQTIKPWGKSYRLGALIDVEDLTRDSYDDLTLAPASQRTVKVYDLSNKKTYTLDSGASGTVLAEPLDILKTGSKQLITKSGTQLRGWRFTGGKKGFSQFSPDTRRVRVTNNTIERVTLQPSISTVTPTTVKRAKNATVTITGANLGSGATVLVNGTTPAKKVKASGEKKLTVTIDSSKLTKNKRFSLKVINADGEQVTYQKLKTK